MRNRGAAAGMRSLLRGLDVLRAINECGPSTVLEIANATGISRASVYRILDTLSQAGYVRRRSDAEGHELTAKVRSLSDGFSDEAWIREIAIPALHELQREIIWPADLAVVQDGWVYVRETTRHQSPLTIDRGTVGLRLPVLLSAAGRAHLAFCAEKERQQLLENIFNRQGGNSAELNPTLVASILAETRSQGYGYRFGEYMPETGSIAVPIIHETRVLGCVNITFIAAVLSPREAAKRYLAPMQNASRLIEHGFRHCLRR